MAEITKQEYIRLRKSGLSQDEIRELQKVGQTPQGEKALQLAAKVTDTIFGSGKIGSLIGTQIAKSGVAGAVGGVNLSEEERQFVAPGPKIKEVIGSGLRSAALFTPTGKIAGAIAPGLRSAGFVPGAAKAFANIGAGAATGFAFDVASDLEQDKSLAEAATPGIGTAIGAAIPAAGELFGAAKRLVGGALKGSGQSIQKTVIKPTARDISDGFNVENIKKYNVGGSLQDTLNKTDDKIDSLSRQLSEKISQADDVSIDSVFRETVEEITKDKSKAFGSIGRLENQLANLKEEISAVSNGTGIVPATEAQKIKRSAGLLGAWKYGAPDPDSNAQEIIYTTFYRKLKEALERTGGPEIQKINKQISDLIPIQHAVIRRIPVAERSQALGLGDLITLSASTVEPSALLLTVGNRAAKSGKVGDFLTKLGDELIKEGVDRTTLQRVLQNVEKAVLSGVTSQTQ